MRVYRGGGLTKDAIYLKGLINLIDYLQTLNSIELLYAGKFNLNHIPLLQDLRHRGIIKEPELPHFFKKEVTQERINLLKNKHFNILNLTTSIDENSFRNQ